MVMIGQKAIKFNFEKRISMINERMNEWIHEVPFPNIHLYV